MFGLTAKIEIKGGRSWEFDKIASVEITRDSETLTDTCVLVLPKKVKWQGGQQMPLKRGDEVTVWLGYDGDLEFAFRGFITTLGLKSPVTIECEDYMFTLKKQAAVKKAYASATVDEILKDQQLPIEHKVFGEQHIGQYRITAETVTGLLGDLKDNGGIRSFIRVENDKPILYSGVLFDLDRSFKQVFCGGIDPTGKDKPNIIDDNSLKEQAADDVKIKVKAISLQPNNKRIRVEVGDSDGETRTLHAYNKTETELRAWAEQELKRLKRDGLTGSFTTFGGDLLDKLDNVAIKIDGQRKGIYQVQKNVITYGAGGFRQEVKLGNRVGE